MTLTDEDVSEDLYGRPTAVELLVAAREFLQSEVMAATEGHVQFHTRVTIRVLDTVIRELELGAGHREQHRRLLAELGYGSSWELVDDIRKGDFDDRIGQLAARLQPDIRAKMEVSDPRYLQAPG